jgi:hypothetical protein
MAGNVCSLTFLRTSAATKLSEIGLISHVRLKWLTWLFVCMVKDYAGRSNLCTVRAPDTKGGGRSSISNCAIDILAKR